MRHSKVRFLWQVSRSALLGFVLGTGVAALLLDQYYREAAAAERHGDPAPMGPGLELGALYVFVLPWVCWALFAMLGVRPAWLAALSGLVLAVPVLGLVQELGAGNELRPAWMYGLATAVGFAAGAAVARLPHFLRSVFQDSG